MPHSTNSLSRFYGKESKKTLEKIRCGLEFYFDQVAAGKPGYPPIDWISTRLAVINQLLESRESKPVNPKSPLR